MCCYVHRFASLFLEAGEPRCRNIHATPVVALSLEMRASNGTRELLRGCNTHLDQGEPNESSCFTNTTVKFHIPSYDFDLDMK